MCGRSLYCVIEQDIKNNQAVVFVTWTLFARGSYTKKITTSQRYRLHNAFANLSPLSFDLVPGLNKENSSQVSNVIEWLYRKTNTSGCLRLAINSTKF